MGRVLLDYDPVRVCYEYTGDEADVEAMREALFSSPAWILLDRGDITEEAAMEIVRERLPDERLKKMADDCMAHWHEYNICPKAVSYTHLDVYKRQGSGSRRWRAPTASSASPDSSRSSAWWLPAAVA